MGIVFWLLGVAVFVGLPTWLIVRTVRKADAGTRVYSPEEVTEKLRKGFFLSGWGLDLAMGAVLFLALLFCDVANAVRIALPIVSLAAGLAVFAVGRIQVGLTTRYLNFCNRKRTEREEWILRAMLRTEDDAMRQNTANAAARLTPGAADDVLSGIGSSDAVSGYMALGRVYTGKNLLKNHWPILCVALTAALLVLFTVIR